ncbi:MAG: glycosyltransferase family 4 protein [Anaerolineaceae bacterium]|nr:glycosyltransferase family 4 protein [Anaerolineaceae bacterium]
MKTLHIIDHFSFGGAQRIVEGILRRMPDALLLPLRKKGGDRMQIAIDENRYLLKPEDNFVRQILNLVKLPRCIKKQNIQIVHCHLHNSWIFGLWIFFSMAARNRPILIFHEHDSVNITRWYYPFLVRGLSRIGTFFAVSHFIQQHIAGCDIPLEKIVLLRNFVDTDRFFPGESSAASVFGLETRMVTDSKIIGFAGRLIEYKGWRVILEIANKMPELYFLIAGEGPDSGKFLSEIRQLGLQDRVILLGYVNHMRMYYQSIDLLIIPSIKEAFGLVQLEAQACGVPVVAFDSEAAQEIHGDNSSVLVHLGDVEMLIRKTQELLDDPSYYQKMVNKGLVNAQLYSLQTYIEKLNRIHEEIIN